jgi:BirA family transcriptional regulator, biotin operon repressor / biotin---[acetyl-CoA-carboxylase] ligase
VSDPLPSELEEALQLARPRVSPLCSRVLYFTCTGSTNDVALKAAEAAAAEGLVVIADEQTAGRGRQGHTWHSPPGSGLYVSIVLRPPLLGGEMPAPGLLTLGAGVALAEAIETISGLRADIKWPNDLLVGRRKLAGILAEAASREAGLVVLGYGINVSTRAFPPELGDRATSLETELGRAIDRGIVFAETLASLASRYDDLLAARFDAILDAWRTLAPGAHGARVAWTTPAGERSGVTAGIDERGALLVRCGDSVERIVAGELTWL